MSRIPIRLHASALLAAGLVTVLLGASVLPSSVPARSGTEYAVAALAGAVLFFLSLLAHEGAHAVLARRNGVGVRRITLWALGGTAELEGEAARPGAAFRIAVVGPLTSLLLGAALVAGALALGGLPAAVLGWLGATNLVLGLFNLLPGAPLDGGRVVAAAVWARTGDARRGRLAAARAGRYVGGGLLVAGAVDAVVGSVAGGLWLALIGCFLLATAQREAAAATAAGKLAELPVQAVMAPATAHPSWLTVGAFLERVAEPTRGSVFALVAFDGSFAGVVTLARLTAVPVAERAGVRVAAVALPVGAVPTVGPAEDAGLLAARLRRSGVVVVVEDGAVTGLVTSTEIARAVQLR